MLRHSGFMVWNRLVYYFEYSTIASRKSEFSGMVRPSPEYAQIRLGLAVLDPRVEPDFSNPERHGAAPARRGFRQGSDLEFRLRPDSNLVQRGGTRALLGTTIRSPSRGCHECL